MIIRKGKKYVVVAKDGTREFGSFDTLEAAQKRLREIEYFKHFEKQKK